MGRRKTTAFPACVDIAGCKRRVARRNPCYYGFERYTDQFGACQSRLKGCPEPIWDLFSGTTFAIQNSRMTVLTNKVESVPYLDLAAQMRPLRKEIDAAIARTLDNCSFCLGPDVVQFEKDFARFCDAEHCVAFNSGTSALHVAMLLLNIGQGDEVITTPSTFVALADVQQEHGYVESG